MKSVYIKFTIIWIVLLVITSCKHEFEKLPASKTDAVKIDIATKLSISYFETLKSGDSYDFRNIATKGFYEKMNSSVQKQTYEEITQQFGQLISVKYDATWVKKTTPQFEIIRLVGQFEKSISPLEIRVIINKDNKISGFWIKPWRNNLNNY